MESLYFLHIHQRVALFHVLQKGEKVESHVFMYADTVTDHSSKSCPAFHFHVTRPSHAHPKLNENSFNNFSSNLAERQTSKSKQKHNLIVRREKTSVYRSQYQLV